MLRSLLTVQLAFSEKVCSQLRLNNLRWRWLKLAMHTATRGSRPSKPEIIVIAMASCARAEASEHRDFSAEETHEKRQPTAIIGTVLPRRLAPSLIERKLVRLFDYLQ